MIKFDDALIERTRREEGGTLGRNGKRRERMKSKNEGQERDGRKDR